MTIVVQCRGWLYLESLSWIVFQSLHSYTAQFDTDCTCYWILNVHVRLYMLLCYCTCMHVWCMDCDTLHIFVGSNGPQKFCIKKLGEPTSLPRAHTWWVICLSLLHYEKRPVNYMLFDWRYVKCILMVIFVSLIQTCTHTHTHTQLQPHRPPPIPKLPRGEGEAPIGYREYGRIRGRGLTTPTETILVPTKMFVLCVIYLPLLCVPLYVPIYACTELLYIWDLEVLITS